MHRFIHTFEVPPGQRFIYQFEESDQAHVRRVRSSAATTATAQFVYN